MFLRYLDELESEQAEETELKSVGYQSLDTFRNHSSKRL